jgi:hypothetical protein
MLKALDLPNWIEEYRHADKALRACRGCGALHPGKRLTR